MVLTKVKQKNASSVGTSTSPVEYMERVYITCRKKNLLVYVH